MPSETETASRAQAPRKTAAKRKVSDTEGMDQQLDPYNAKVSQPPSKVPATADSKGEILSVYVVSGLTSGDDDNDSFGATAIVVAESKQQAGEILFKEYYPSSAPPEDETVAKAVADRVSGWLENAVKLNLEKEGFFELTNGATQALVTASQESTADARISKKKLKLFLTKNFKSQSLIPSAAAVVAPSSEAARKKILDHVAENVQIDLRPPGMVADQWLGDEGAIEEIDIGEHGFYYLQNGGVYSEE